MNDIQKVDILKTSVLNKIKNTSKIKPITSKQLCADLNISFRLLKRVITILREDYPIVAKETNGGGYWIAESEADILKFISMINARKSGYEDTINKMKKHLRS